MHSLLCALSLRINSRGGGGVLCNAQTHVPITYEMHTWSLTKEMRVSRYCGVENRKKNTNVSVQLHGKQDEMFVKRQ